MAPEPPEFDVLGLGFALFAVLASVSLFAMTFPQPSGHDVGGPPVFLWMSVPIVATGGVLLGIELSKLSRVLRYRPVVAVLQLVGVSIVMTPALVYGRVVVPRYFDLDVIRLWYSLPIMVGAVLVAIQHGYGFARDRVTASS